MRRRGIRLHGAPVALLMILLLAGRAAGQAEIGSVVSTEGVLEVQRDGAKEWEPVLLGTGLLAADRIRTDATGGARILFRDESVLDLAPSTELMVERVGVDPAGDRSISLVYLTTGKIRAVVGEQYGARHSRYEVETPTAVVTSHGGQVVVVYDTQNEITDVLVLEREVEVKATLGVIGPGVTVSTDERAQVRKGRFPSAAGPLEPAALDLALRGLAILGTGLDRGVGDGHPAMDARVLRPEDLPHVILPLTETSGKASQPVEQLQLPAETLAERISPDMRVQKQPIPEFRAARPGDPPSGGVQVDF